MFDDISSVQSCEDFSRERLQLNQHLEKMTEQMENVSAYDMVVVRTSPDLAESLKCLENEFLKCKAVICGPTDKIKNLILLLKNLILRKKKMESEGNSTENSDHGASDGLDYILKQLDFMSELTDQLEVKIQLLQCNLTVCFTHPDNMACLQADVQTPTWLSHQQTMED